MLSLRNTSWSAYVHILRTFAGWSRRQPGFCFGAVGEASSSGRWFTPLVLAFPDLSGQDSAKILPRSPSIFVARGGLNSRGGYADSPTSRYTLWVLIALSMDPYEYIVYQSPNHKPDPEVIHPLDPGLQEPCRRIELNPLTRLVETRFTRRT